jgi:hypothetical protein
MAFVLLDVAEDGRRILGIGPYARIGEVVKVFCQSICNSVEFKAIDEYYCNAQFVLSSI